MSNAPGSKLPRGGSLIKGTAFRGYRRFLEKRVSPDVRKDILGQLPQKVVELLSGESLLVSSMYPIELQHAFLDAFAKGVGGDAEAHLRQLGAEVAATDLSGVYRVFIWAASVPQTMQVLTKVWNSYFSTGVARWQSDGSCRGVTRIEDRHQHRLHHPVVAGYIEVAIRLAGGKNAAVTYENVNEHTADFTSSWAAK
jgi:hypothetical protein